MCVGVRLWVCVCVCVAVRKLHFKEREWTFQVPREASLGAELRTAASSSASPPPRASADVTSYTELKFFLWTEKQNKPTSGKRISLYQKSSHKWCKEITGTIQTPLFFCFFSGLHIFPSNQNPRFEGFLKSVKPN